MEGGNNKEDLDVLELQRLCEEFDMYGGNKSSEWRFLAGNALLHPENKDKIRQVIESYEENKWKDKE